MDSRYLSIIGLLDRIFCRLLYSFQTLRRLPGRMDKECSVISCMVYHNPIKGLS